MKSKIFVMLSFVGAAQAAELKQGTFNVCGRSVKMDIARTEAERSKGLGHRTGIAAGHGMVFVFERPQPLVFWMKDVPFDIDIGFFDSKGKLLSALTMAGASPLVRDEALPRYPGPENSQFAVEVPPGFFTRRKASSPCYLKPTPTL